MYNFNLSRYPSRGYDIIKKGSDLMKISLRSSILKEDYGIISLYNAFLYLFEKEEIKENWIEELMRFYLHKRQNRERKTIEKWFYDREMDDLITVQFVNGKQVNEAFIEKAILEKGCVLIPIYLKKHYVLVTQIDDNYVYVFDPYEKENQQNYNRKIEKHTFFHGIERDGSLGPVKERTCLYLAKSIKIFDYEKN